MISGGNDKRVLYWSLVKNETKLIGTHDGLVLCLSISQSSTFVVSGGADNKIMLWNLIDSGNNREIG